MCTDFEKTIYNVYLRESRKSKNLPYRTRKNFQKLNEKTSLCLQKLSSFFQTNREVSIEDFFKAPYSVYPDDSNFDLAFYTTQKAKGVYKIFLQSKSTELKKDVDISK
jgi:hypothetical protein